MISIFRRSMIASVLLTICFALSAQGQASKASSFEAQASSVTEFEVNGLKVIVRRRPSAATVGGGLFIRGGARNINEKDAGIENLMLATAVEAGQKIPRATIRRELSRLGSGIASGVTNDFSAMSFVSTRETFDRVWDIFTEVAINPAFTEQDIKLTRDRILTGLRETGISPESALQILQDKVVFAGHPYANNVNGTVANISKFTSADLRAYHKSVMQTSQLLLVIVGDIDPEQLKARVASTFGRLPRGSYKEGPLAPLDFSKGTLNITARVLPTDYVQGTFGAPSLRDPDYFAMRVAISMLGTLVNEEVRVRRQLSYAPDADIDENEANTATISVSSTDANQAVAVMLDQIKLLQNNTLPDEMIGNISDYFLTKHYLSLETNSAQAAELARYELIGGGWRNSFEFLNGVRSVKPADVRAVSNKYMKNIRFAVVGNERAIDKSIFVPAE